MSQLSCEAENAVTQYGIKLSNQSRKVLSEMNDNPDRQTKYVVNPVVQYTMESCLNQWFENFKQNMDRERGVAPVVTKDVTPTPVDAVKPAEAEDEDDGDMDMGGLFD